MWLLPFLFGGYWLTNWPIIYGVLVEYGPPGVFQKNLRLSTQNKKPPNSLWHKDLQHIDARFFDATPCATNTYAKSKKSQKKHLYSIDF